MQSQAIHPSHTAPAPEELALTLSGMDAGERLRFLRYQYGPRLMATTSFGLQAAAMLHLIATHAPDVPVVFIDTGFLFPETYRYADELTRRFDLDLRIYQPNVSAARMQALQEQLKNTQEELGNKRVTGSAGGDLVEVTMSGTQELLEVRIKPEACDPDDVESLQDLIVGALGDASKKAQTLAGTVSAQQYLPQLAKWLEGMGYLNPDPQPHTPTGGGLKPAHCATRL